MNWIIVTCNDQMMNMDRISFGDVFREELKRPLSYDDSDSIPPVIYEIGHIYDKIFSLPAGVFEM